MEILTLLKANIRHKKGAFVSVILLMMMITLSFSVTVSNNDNVLDGINRSHKTADTGDLAAFIDESKLDDNILKCLSEDENIMRIRDERAMAFLSYKIGEREGKIRIFFLNGIIHCPFSMKSLWNLKLLPIICRRERSMFLRQ